MDAAIALSRNLELTLLLLLLAILGIPVLTAAYVLLCRREKRQHPEEGEDFR